MSMKDKLHTGELYLTDDEEIGSSSFWFFCAFMRSSSIKEKKNNEYVWITKGLSHFSDFRS